MPVAANLIFSIMEILIFLKKNKLKQDKLIKAINILFNTKGIDSIIINSPKIPVNPHTNIIKCKIRRLCLLVNDISILFQKVD